MSPRRPAARPEPGDPASELVSALDAWQRGGGPGGRRALRRTVASLASLLDLTGLELRVDGPGWKPITERVGKMDALGKTQPLASPLDGRSLGSITVAGDADAGVRAGAILSAAMAAVEAEGRAQRAVGNLVALDAAVQGIAGVHGLDRVLQLIVDRVRELADAQYAALGIVDDDGNLERFLTSGISAPARRRIGDLPRGRGLLGLIIREHSSFRIDDISTDPRRHGFPPNHPEMHSFLGVPVSHRDQSVGNLYLTNKRGGGPFSAEDQVLVERFARHAGLAIENARLGLRVQQLAVMEDRERIGRDLHDGVIQRIYGVTLALEEVGEMAAEHPDAVGGLVDAAIDTLHQTIGEIREFIYGLRPGLGDVHDLGTGLELLADEVRRHAGLRVDVEVATHSPAADAGTELLNIAREALSNVVRHADATRVTVRLERKRRALRLEIADDGRGFDAGRRRSPSHQGLGNMHRRAQRLGGTLAVASQPGAGTRIIVTLPESETGTGQEA